MASSEPVGVDVHQLDDRRVRGRVRPRRCRGERPVARAEEHRHYAAASADGRAADDDVDCAVAVDVTGPDGLHERRRLIGEHEGRGCERARAGRQVHRHARGRRPAGEEG